MQHNAYAVLHPTKSVYEADYRVYIGDVTDGAPLPGYGYDDVTWTWNAAVLRAGTIGNRCFRDARGVGDCCS